MRFGKRLLDIILSCMGLIVLAIPMMMVAIAIKIEDPGPALFRQTRVGNHKKHFDMYKFRSMTQDAPRDVPTHLLEKPDRYLLKVGRFIRRASIDELPQMWNILVGDMSIIGPRPALWNQDDLIAERDKYGANDVKPGLSGWAQVNGRDALTTPIKARMDGEYVSNRCFSFDMKCFIATIFVTLRAEGVIEGGVVEEKTKGCMDK